MSQENIRDRTGKVLGYIVTESNGDQKAYKNGFGLVGHYRKDLNRTFTRTGAPVSNGNTVSGLLFE